MKPRELCHYAEYSAVGFAPAASLRRLFIMARQSGGERAERDFDDPARKRAVARR
jgi:hypothetical protein